MNSIPWYLTLVRLIVPISILRFPLFGILASIYVDSADWKVIGVTSDNLDYIYQNWDKAMDLYSFLFILWIVYKWKDTWARNTAFGFFIYRMLGDVLFWITSWKPIFFFFPNVFENFVILCLVTFWLTKKKKLNFSLVQKTIMLGVLIIPKLINEYFQHLLDQQPWETYSFGSLFGFTGPVLAQVNWILWGILLYIVPALGFLLFAKATNK